MSIMNDILLRSHLTKISRKRWKSVTSEEKYKHIAKMNRARAKKRIADKKLLKKARAAGMK